MDSFTFYKGDDVENKISLRDLVHASNSITEALIDGGELTPELESALAVIETNLPEKIDGYHIMMTRLEEEAKYFKEKAAEFSLLANRIQNTQCRLKESIKQAMRDLGEDELKGNDYRFKLTNLKPKLVIDEIHIDRSYYMQVTKYEIDKKKIEEDLKLGVPVKGAKLEEIKALRLYLNSRGDS